MHAAPFLLSQVLQACRGNGSLRTQAQIHDPVLGNHVQLHCMFEVGAPYMTIYIDGLVQCSCHRILKGVYNAQGLPRTAQRFLCCGPGGVTVDVINVHAPSGKRRLTDQQRQTLLTNLLQSNSKSMPEKTIGSARFLIGRDMNTPPYSMSQLLQVCRGNGSLHTQEHIHNPVFGKHGDLCFLGGFKADSLTTTAKNHDLQHKPYGICWTMVRQARTTSVKPVWMTVKQNHSN